MNFDLAHLGDELGLDWGPVRRRWARAGAQLFGVDLCDERHELDVACTYWAAQSFPSPAAAEVLGERLGRATLPADWLHDWAVQRAGQLRLQDVAAGRGGTTALQLFRPALSGGPEPDITDQLVLHRAQQGWLEEWRQEERWVRPQDAAAAEGRAPSPDEGSTLGIISLHVRPRRMLREWRPSPGFSWCNLCGASPAIGDSLTHDPACPRAKEVVSP